MFKNEYKEQLSKIHPSQELIEKTRQRALKAYEDSNKKSLEEEERAEQKKKHKVLVRRVEIFGLASAAIIAITTVSVWMNSSLTVDHKKVPQVAVVDPTKEPEKEQIEATEKVSEQKKDSKKKTSVETQEVEKTAVLAENTIRNLANSARLGGCVLDYASERLVVMHGNFGIIAYSLENKKIVGHVPAKEYFSEDMWQVETVKVAADEKQIYWRSALSSGNTVGAYEIAEKKVSKFDFDKDDRWNLAISAKTVEVSGTEADVYSAGVYACDNMILLGTQSCCQLIYQAPDSDKQASLAVVFLNIQNKSEKIYSVFGEFGKQIENGTGHEYKQCYNENGEKIFGNDNKQEASEQQETEETVQPTQPEATEEVIETEQPVETEVPMEEEAKKE